MSGLNKSMDLRSIKKICWHNAAEYAAMPGAQKPNASHLQHDGLYYQQALHMVVWHAEKPVA